MASNVVVVIGPSTAGKSLVPKILSERGCAPPVFETDVELARQLVPAPSFGDTPHLFEAFMSAYQKDGNTRHLVETVLPEHEGKMLRDLARMQGPLLVITGPSIPVRPEWQSFVRAHPNAHYVYLKRSADVIAKMLRARDAKYGADYDIAEQAGFMSWNDGLTVEYDPGTGSYRELDESMARDAVARVYEKQFEAYNVAQTETIDVDTEDYEALMARIGAVAPSIEAALGLNQ